MSVLSTSLALDVCNQALTILGEGRCVESFSENTPESEACARLFPQTVNLCSEFANWSFSRKDEVIDETNLLKDVVSLPYKYSYSIPSDVLRILYLCPVTASSVIETKVMRQAIQFNFRNYDNRKILVTDAAPSFAVHYQAYLEDLRPCSPMFLEGLAHVLAYKLSTALIKGVEGFKLGSLIYKTGIGILQVAAQIDAQQGAYSIDTHRQSKFLDARR